MDANTARKLLTAERERLEETREGVWTDVEAQKESTQELSAVDQHPGDLGTETFEREKDASIAESVDAELAEIDAAFHRVDEGSYGVCEVCGKQIPDERLEAVPATRHCIEHQAQQEKTDRAGG